MSARAVLPPFAAVVACLAASCGQPEGIPAVEQAAAAAAAPVTAAAPAPAGMMRGKVVETMDAGGYTYVRVQPDSGDAIWAAGPQTAVRAGDVVVVETTMPMPGHESPTLQRKFDVVYFCGSINVVGAAAEAPSAGMAGAMSGSPHGAAGAVPAAMPDLAGIARLEGGLTVAEINEQSAALAGKQAAFRGRVVKFTPRVMGRNWLHVRDGSGEGGGADITVTTGDSAAVGDLVVVRGSVAVNQDFGSGYSYAVLVQDATVQAEAPGAP